MKHTVEVGSGAMIYTPSFKKIGSGIKALMGGDSQTHRRHAGCISLPSLFQNKESTLKLYVLSKY
jgi:hypothetical protein